jgi:hypothetical protein
MKSIVATPLVDRVTEAWSVSIPEIYAVVILQVIVMFPVVLLKILTASPSLKVASGIVIEPPVPT